MRALIILLLLCSPVYATMEGVWTGADYMADKKILIAKSHVLVTVDTETGKSEVVEEKQDRDVAVVSCVSLDGGKCEESEYFKVTITDVED